MSRREPALARFVQGRFGFRTAQRETDKTVTSAGVEIVPNNPNRLHIVLTNTGAVYATISLRRSIALDRGIRLDPNGGSVTFDPEVDGEGVGYAIFGISSGADVNITSIETVSVGDVTP